MKRFGLSILFALMTAISLFAQWECPSQLGAYLKPIGQSNLYWSSEFVGGAGYLSNNLISNSMGIIGLDWSGKKSSLYFEGGFKYWYRYDLDNSKDYSNQHLGIRELYYQYKADREAIILGVHSARLDDDFLLNERVLGANLRFNRGKWSFNVLGGTVTKDFARNGYFCNVGYLYDILPGRERTLIGNAIGQTNLASFSINYQPAKNATKTISEQSANEFSTDEFPDGLNTDSAGKPGKLKIESIGAIAYHEFGNWTDQKFITTGLFAKAEWGNGWYFKPEVLFQSASSNQAIIYSFNLERTVEGVNNHAILNLRYVGKTNIDPDARILNSFSNIFAGDVIRLDAIDASFLQAGVKYSFPKAKIHLKAQLNSQLSDRTMEEFDFEAGKKFGKHLQINALSGLVKSTLLTSNACLGRVEFRYYF